MIEELLTQFISADTVEKMGAWYPRVLAVMSCVIPFMYVLAVIGFHALALYALWRILR